MRAPVYEATTVTAQIWLSGVSLSTRCGFDAATLRTCRGTISAVCGVRGGVESAEDTEETGLVDASRGTSSISSRTMRRAGLLCRHAGVGPAQPRSASQCASRSASLKPRSKSRTARNSRSMRPMSALENSAV